VDEKGKRAQIRGKLKLNDQIYAKGVNNSLEVYEGGGGGNLVFGARYSGTEWRSL
jgi:hypothetical protein